MIVTDGFTGNVFLKVMEGTADALLRAVRDAATCEPRAKPGGLPAAARRCAGCATRSTPRRRAARSCSGCAGSASSRTARSARSGIARAIELAARGVRADVVGQTYDRLGGRGRAAAARRDADRRAGAVRPTGYGADP